MDRRTKGKQRCRQELLYPALQRKKAKRPETSKPLQLDENNGELQLPQKNFGRTLSWRSMEATVMTSSTAVLYAAFVVQCVEERFSSQNTIFQRHRLVSKSLCGYALCLVQKISMS